MRRATRYTAGRFPVKPVALVGFMGAGKSTVGALLAERLGVGFADLDDEIERAWGPIPDQIATDGEAAFRAREAEVVRRLCGDPVGVLATGGGAWVDPDSRAGLQQAYVTVYLRAPLAVLAERGGASGRPLWDERVAERFAARQPLYEQAAYGVDTVGVAPRIVVERIVALLEEGA